MAKTFFESDADLALIQGEKVAIIGYGSQGHAHALNLNDSGVEVRVGLPAASKSRAKVEGDGLMVQPVADVAAWADVIMILTPDTSAPEVYERDVKPALRAGKTIMFAHGFNIRFGTIVPVPEIDVSMIAPKAPGQRLRNFSLRAGASRHCSQSIRT